MKCFEVDCAIFSTMDHTSVWHDCLQVQAEDSEAAIALVMKEMENMVYLDERIDPYRVIYGIELSSEDLEEEQL